MNTRSIEKYNALYWLIPGIFIIAAFILWSPQADAKIVVEGDQKFKDEVNDCLNTYGNDEGFVGDVIRELKNSSNEHKIINSPDWTNTVNNPEDAHDGTGTGTVTRVDKKNLEELVKEIDELKNKDFCTALLHELWHAFDADRGEWTSDEIDGVKRNEIEATLFQNFVHAIRGVPPRTHYGKDISKHVVIGDGPAEEAGSESRVEMLVYQGGYYPKSQFFVEDHSNLPGCDAPHWHANSTVWGLAGKTSTTSVSANDPGGCGFGKVSEVPVEFVNLTLQQSTELIKNVNF